MRSLLLLCYVVINYSKYLLGKCPNNVPAEVFYAWLPKCIHPSIHAYTHDDCVHAYVHDCVCIHACINMSPHVYINACMH